MYTNSENREKHLLLARKMLASILVLLVILSVSFDLPITEAITYTVSQDTWIGQDNQTVLLSGSDSWNQFISNGYNNTTIVNEGGDATGAITLRRLMAKKAQHMTDDDFRTINNNSNGIEKSGNVKKIQIKGQGSNSLLSLNYDPNSPYVTELISQKNSFSWGNGNDIALDRFGSPHISFTGGDDNSVFHASYVGSGGTCSNTAWNCELISDLYPTNFTSIEIYTDPIYDTDTIYITYRERSAGNLVLASKGPHTIGTSQCANATDWKCLTVATGIGVKVNEVSVDSTGTVFIAARTSYSTLKLYAVYQDGTVLSSVFDSQVAANVIDMKIDMYDGMHIVYRDKQPFELIYAYRANTKTWSTLGSCSAVGTCSNGWTSESTESATPGTGDSRQGIQITLEYKNSSVYPHVAFTHGGRNSVMYRTRILPSGNAPYNSTSWTATEEIHHGGKGNASINLTPQNQPVIVAFESGAAAKPLDLMIIQKGMTGGCISNKGGQNLNWKCTSLEQNIQNALNLSAVSTTSPDNELGNTFISHAYDQSGDGLYITTKGLYQTASYVNSFILINKEFTKFSWVQNTPAGTGVTFKVRSGNSRSELDSKSWCSIGNGQSLPSACVTDGDTILEYWLSLSTTANSIATPEVSEISVTYNAFETSGSLTSNVFNSQDEFTSISKVWWDGIAGDTESDVEFFVRTGPSYTTDDFTGWTPWCGKDNSSAGCDSINGIKETSVGVFDLIDSELSDGINDSFFQYKMVFSSDGKSTYQVNKVYVDYVINSPPTVNNVTAYQQTISDLPQGSVDTGKVVVTYDLDDVDPNNSQQDVYLFYDIKAALGANVSSGGETTITLKNSVNNFPQSGLIMIDDEFVFYSGLSGSQLTGIVRAANKSIASSHAIDTKVWVMATQLSGDYGTGQSANDYNVILGSGRVPKATGKSILWDINSESNLSNYYNNTFKIKITANDQERANPIGSSNSLSFEIDTKPPDISLASVSINNGQAKTLSENITLDIVGASDDTLPADILYMDIANTEEVFGSVWENYSATKSWVLKNPSVDGIKSIKTRFRDKYNNINPASVYVSDDIILDKTPPAPPANLSAQDVSVNENLQALLTWDISTPDPGDFSSYNIYRDSALIGKVDSLNTIDPANPRLVNILLDIGLSEIQYVYTVSASDDIGNESSLSNSFPITPASGNIIDASPPIITHNPGSVSFISENGATIDWTTDEVSDSYIAFTSSLNSANAGTYEFIQGNPTMGTSHSVSLIGLSNSTQYYYEIRSTDQENNESKLNREPDTGDPPVPGPLFSFNTAEGGDTTAPILSNHQSPITTANSASFSWDTTGDSSTSLVKISGGGLNGSVFGKYDPLVQNHSISVTNLLPNTQYSYTLISVDGSGNKGELTGTFNTTGETSDAVGPVINPDSVNAINISSNSATIVWEVDDESSNSFVEYGIYNSNLPAQFGNVAGSYELAGKTPEQHVVRLNGLNPQTPYEYRVRSIDSAGNESIYPLGGGVMLLTTTQDLNDTTKPSISNVTVNTTDSSSASINWTTNEASNSWIKYSEGGTSFNLLQGSNAIVEPVGGVSSHNITLFGLNPGTQYYFSVESVDQSGNIATDENTDYQGIPQGYVFATDISTTNTPDIDETAISVTDINEHGATINWTTDVNSNSYVDLGFESGTYIETFGIPDTYSTNHSLILPEHLLADTTYYYRIRSTTAEGNTGVSYPGDFTNLSTLNFTTNPSNMTIAANDTTKPTISSVSPLLVTQNSAVITWNTDEPATSFIDYGANLSYGSTSTLNTILTQIHSVKIDNLDPNTTYLYKVVSSDFAGNSQTDDNSGLGHTLVTEEVQVDTVTVVQSIEGDISPPSVFNIEVVDITSSSATVNWNTNEGSVSLLSYGEETNIRNNIEGQTDDFLTDHTVTLSGLTASTTYFYAAIGLDSSGNRSSSPEMSFTTSGLSAEDMARAALEAKLKDAADKRQLDLFTKLLGLSSTTQDIVQGFFDSLNLLPEEEKDKALEIVFSEFIKPPRILGSAPSVEISDTEAIIMWETIKETTGIVSYATEHNFRPESEDPYGKSSGSSNVFEQKHTITLTDLKPFTEYHYQLTGEEKNGQIGISIDRTFKTLPLQPKFISIKKAKITENSATIRWETNLPTSGILSLTDLVLGGGVTREDENIKLKHELTISNLLPETPYAGFISIKSEDDVVVKSNRISFTTGKDNVPPQILQVRSKLTLSPGKDDIVQALVNWITDEQSISYVKYAEGLATKDELSQKSQVGTELSSTHVVVLPKLKPATIYTIRAVSIDAAGNEAISKEYKLFTPRKQESVLELIIKNFEETFDFLNEINR